MKRLAICLFCLIPMLAVADDQKALEYYKKGLEAENRQDVYGAIDWYKKALDEKSYDGYVTLPGKVSYEWVETPRGMQRRRVEGRGPTESYQPRARLKALEQVAQKQRSDQNRKQKFAQPPRLEVAVQLVDAGNDRALDGGEHGKLIISVNNNGASRADDVTLVLNADNSAISMDRNIQLGSIEPGKSIMRTVEYSVSKGIRDGDVRLTISGKERDGFSPAPVNVRAVARAYQPPQIIVARPSITRAEGTLLMVTYEVTNAGRGVARDVRASIKADNRIVLQDESYLDKHIGTLAPNETRRFEVGVYTSIQAGNPLPISLVVAESDPTNNITQDLALMVPAGGGSFGGNAYAFTPVAPVTQAVENVGINVPEGTRREDFAVGVVIGNSAYEQIDPVKFAAADAAVVSDYLVKTMGYDARGVKLEQNIRGRDFRRIFGTREAGFKNGELYRRVVLNADRRANPPVFVYYSGHGAPSMREEGRAYMVPVDTSLRDLELDAYPLDDFYAAIAALPTNNVTVVIDSCFSGSSNNGLLQKDISPAMLKTASSITPAQAGNASIFTSTAPSEVSYWYEEGRHSLFTYFFLKGLRGEADEDKDASITAAELHDYLQWHVKDYILEAGKPSNQTPQLVGEKNRVMAAYAR